MALLKTHKLAGMEEIGQELTELQHERHSMNEQLAQALTEATSARHAAEDSTQIRERSKVDALSPDTGLPAYVDISDEAIYARRARIALQMRSVIESIACSPDHTVKIVMKTGTAYELIEKEWICTRQGPQTPSGKPSVAKSFVGRATWQIGLQEKTSGQIMRRLAARTPTPGIRATPPGASGTRTLKPKGPEALTLRSLRVFPG